MILSFAFITLLSFLSIGNSINISNDFYGESNSTISPSYYASSQWAIGKIELDKAWDISTGSSDVLVGVIDSGIRGTHEDLLSNLSTIKAYTSGNGYSTSLEDLHGHGTHVAGIIGADGSNSAGVAGVCWNISISSLRGGHIEGDNNVMSNTELYSLITFATNSNILFINLSYGGFSLNGTVASAILNYPGLFICSAGNQNYNLNDVSHYPASYNYENMIVVGNSTSLDEKASTSNYGTEVVDIFAPGTSIWSTMKNNDSDYACWSGTSMAAPYVTGVAALLKSINPTLTPAQIKAAILDNADHITALNTYCPYGRRLNAYKAALAVLPTFTTDQTINSIQAIPVGGHQWYKINASACTRHFTNLYSIDLTASLYSDVQGTPLITGSSNGGYLFNYTFPSSGTYYLKVTNNSSFSSSYSIAMSNSHVHVYENSYEWRNSTQHYAYCECGSSTIQAHIVQSGTNTCMLCHGTASGGFIGPLSIGQSILTDSYLYPNGNVSLGQIDYNNYINGLLTVDEIYEGALYA